MALQFLAGAESLLSGWPFFAHLSGVSVESELTFACFSLPASACSQAHPRCIQLKHFVSSRVNQRKHCKNNGAV